MNDRLIEKLDGMVEEMSRKEKLSASDLQILDWATHIKKSMLCTEEMDGGYSGNYSGYTERGYSRGGRRRDSMGRYASDYSRNYSRDGFADHLRNMMEDAPDEKTRQSIQRMLRDMEA